MSAAKKRTRSKSESKSASRRSARKAASQHKQFNWLWAVAGLAVVIVVVAAVVLLQGDTDQAATSLAAEITVDEAYEKYQAGVFFLDVRTPEEWVEYHAPNTTLIPLDELAMRVDELPRDQEIVVVCRSGNRSQEGRNIMLSAGFTQVTSMAGGLNAWRDSGYPIVSGP